MPNPQPIPASALALLPDSDRRAPAEELASGAWVVAGKHALILVDAERVLDSGMWYEVATAKWSAEDRILDIEWMDPARSKVRVETVSKDPHVLMRTIADRVNHSIVVHKSTRVANGTTISAWIRRRDDDRLFSALTALGPLDAASEREAAAFERMLREGVGLD